MNLLVFITPQITKSRRSEKGYLYFDSGNKSCSAPPPSWSSGVLYLLFEAWVRGTGEVLEPDSASVSCALPSRWRARGPAHHTTCWEPATGPPVLINQAIALKRVRGRRLDVFFPRMSFFLRAFCTLPRPPSVQVRLLPTDDRWEKSRLTRETISSSSLFSVHPGLHDPSFTGSPVFCLFSPPFGIGN